MEPKEETGQKIKFTPDFKANEPTFWRVFKELANENMDWLLMINYKKDIATGKLDAARSVLMIKYMKKTGKIEHTEQYHVYRRRIALSPKLKHNTIMM